MTTQSGGRPSTTPRSEPRFLIRLIRTAFWTVLFLFLYFMCQGMFSGYPQYDTDLLSNVGLILVVLTGGAAWLIDERRLAATD
jgi:uncharacterized membrane protein YphA (DoxX/SURF4 family)